MIYHNSILKRTLPLLIQCAEAHRKPRWLPVAKSKIFRIPKRPVVSEEEQIELRRINNNYKTQMRAISRFYHEEMIKEKSTLESASSEMSQRLEADEWERCVKLNEKWNAQVAAEREERRKKELEAMEEFTLAYMEEKDKLLKERIAKATEEIKRAKEISATFITMENLDEAIEHALANTTDYNFAIDPQGEKCVGRDTQILNKEQKQKAAGAN